MSSRKGLAPSMRTALQHPRNEKNRHHDRHEATEYGKTICGHWESTVKGKEPPSPKRLTEAPTTPPRQIRQDRKEKSAVGALSSSAVR